MLSLDRDEASLKVAIQHLADQPDIQLIVTSKQTARMLIAASAAIHDRPVWCVGAGTATLLTEAGFTKVIAGKGDAHSLIQSLIAAHGSIQQSTDKQQNTPAYLWPSGADIAVDIRARLAICPVRSLSFIKAVFALGVQPLPRLPGGPQNRCDGDVTYNAIFTMAGDERDGCLPSEKSNQARSSPAYQS